MGALKDKAIAMAEEMMAQDGLADRGLEVFYTYFGLVCDSGGLGSRRVIIREDGEVKAVMGDIQFLVDLDFDDMTIHEAVAEFNRVNKAQAEIAE